MQRVVAAMFVQIGQYGFCRLTLDLWIRREKIISRDVAGDPLSVLIVETAVGLSILQIFSARDSTGSAGHGDPLGRRVGHDEKYHCSYKASPHAFFTPTDPSPYLPRSFAIACCLLHPDLRA